MLYCPYVNSMFDVGVLSTRVQSCPLGYFGQMTSPSQTPASSQSTVIAFRAVVWISLKCLPSSQDSTMLVLFFFRMLQVVHFFFFLLKEMLLLELIDIMFLQWVACVPLT